MAAPPTAPPFGSSKFNGGYEPLPPHEPGYYQTIAQAPSGYAPAPGVLTHQYNANVVVVNQPTAVTPIAQPVTVARRASTYMVLTFVLLVLCLLQCNLAALFCLIPALVFALLADRNNNSGKVSTARNFGSVALCCNVCVLTLYILFFIAGVIVLGLYLAGIAFIDCYSSYVGSGNSTYTFCTH